MTAAHRKAFPRSRIVGPTGQPLSGYLYPSPSRSASKYRPRQQLQKTTKENITERDRLELVNYSRQLYAQVGDLATAIEQKNSWAFGDAWDPQFAGKNETWGEEAETFLKEQFYPSCNIRGPVFDFRRTLLISGNAWDYDGDDVMVFTESESGFPQVAVFPSTMIRTFEMGGGSGKDTLVQGGRYDGARIYDGIIYNRNNRAIAVRLWDENGKYTEISMFDCDLAFEPEWPDQGRGIPKPSKCLLRWMDLQDLDWFIQKAMKRAATMTINRFTADGETLAGPNTLEEEVTVTNGDGTTETRDILVEEVGDGDDIVELSAEEGEEIKLLEYKSPHPNQEAFVERIKRECLTSVGWHYELLNLGSTGRAPSRLVCRLGNQSIWARQCTAERRWKRVIRWAIAKGMKNGFVSKNNDGLDPYRWEFGMPARLTVDEGNDKREAREAVKFGLSTKDIEAQKEGFRGKAIRKARKSEVQAEAEDAAELQKFLEQKGVKVSYEWCAERISQTSPNPPVQPQQNKQQQTQQAPQK